MRRRSKKEPKFCRKCCDQSWRVVGGKCEKCGLLYAEEKLTFQGSLLQSVGDQATLHLQRGRPVSAGRRG